MVNSKVVMNTFAKSLFFAALVTAVLVSDRRTHRLQRQPQQLAAAPQLAASRRTAALGTLGVGNVTAFAIQLSPPASSVFTITNLNSQMFASQGLLATAADLSFDFSGTGAWLMQNRGGGE